MHAIKCAHSYSYQGNNFAHIKKNSPLTTSLYFKVLKTYFLTFAMTAGTAATPPNKDKMPAMIQPALSDKPSVLPSPFADANDGTAKNVKTPATTNNKPPQKLSKPAYFSRALTLRTGPKIATNKAKRLTKTKIQAIKETGANFALSLPKITVVPSMSPSKIHALP